MTDPSFCMWSKFRLNIRPNLTSIVICIPPSWKQWWIWVHDLRSPYFFTAEKMWYWNAQFPQMFIFLISALCMNWSTTKTKANNAWFWHNIQETDVFLAVYVVTGKLSITDTGHLFAHIKAKFINLQSRISSCIPDRRKQNRTKGERIL